MSKGVDVKETNGTLYIKFQKRSNSFYQVWDFSQQKLLLEFPYTSLSSEKNKNKRNLTASFLPVQISEKGSNHPTSQLLLHECHSTLDGLWFVYNHHRIIPQQSQVPQKPVLPWYSVDSDFRKSTTLNFVNAFYLPEKMKW